jgi:CrcB protein
MYWIIGIGGFIGASLRMLIGEVSWIIPYSGIFPMGTWLCNVLGSFLLAALFKITINPYKWSTNMRLFLGTGLLGSFTTFSALSVELFALIDQSEWLIAGMYAVASLLGGLIMAWLGWTLTPSTPRKASL